MKRGEKSNEKNKPNSIKQFQIIAKHLHFVLDIFPYFIFSLITVS